jgi:hypothetical protein
MRISGGRIGLGLIVLAASPLSGCGGIAQLDCNGVAERAVRMSQERPIRIESIAKVRETARTETELRCTGDATLADGGTAPLYFRASEDMPVAYQGTPYPEAARQGP